MNDYEAFNLELEDGPHVAIPRSIRGDFSLLTAPSGRSACFILIGLADRTHYTFRSSFLPPSWATGSSMVDMAGHRFQVAKQNVQRKKEA